MEGEEFYGAAYKGTKQFTQHLLGQHGFVLDESQTILYGRCEKCEAKRLQQNGDAASTNNVATP